MQSRICAYIFAVVLVLLASHSTRGAEVTAAVEAAYPQWLIEQAGYKMDGSTDFRRFTGYAESSFGTGIRYVVAAYSNETHGAVRLLRLSASGEWQVVSDPEIEMAGRQVAVELQDLTGDAIPEILVHFSSLQNVDIYWIFRFSDGRLLSLSPPANEFFGEGLPQPEFVDLDADGDKDLVVTGVSRQAARQPSARADEEDAEAQVEAFLYFLRDDRYHFAARCPFVESFGRTRSSPDIEHMSFAVPEGGAGSLVILNGHPRGTPVSSGRVRLNGQLVTDESDFKRGRAVITIPVTFNAVNELSVELAGKPGSWITVLARQ